MPVRISAVDLREAARKSAAVRAEAAERGEETPEVFLDVEVIIDRNAAAAFTALDSQPQQAGSPGPLRYVGTPRGLAGLISDVQRLGIADGVVLLARSEDQVVGLMLDELAPGLGSAKGFVPA
jgi:alkanesulfonate monooxygenase SsuD/methylene tetrahydromethanopterin reductase-like flavin-dependent oxidoreductase (luciferase family)